MIAMATVQIYYWKDIPYGVRARDEKGRVTRHLPPGFGAAGEGVGVTKYELRNTKYAIRNIRQSVLRITYCISQDDDAFAGRYP